MTAILLFNLPFPDLTCYLSFSIGSIVFIFLTQAVIAYFTMFKKFECDTGTKVGKSIVFSLISTPFYSILFGVTSASLYTNSNIISILMIIGLFIYCITSYRWYYEIKTVSNAHRFWNYLVLVIDMVVMPPVYEIDIS